MSEMPEHTSTVANASGATEPDEVVLALCIYGESLVPSEVSAKLQCTPTHSHVKGEVGKPEGRPFPKGAWLLEIRRAEPIDLEAMFEELFAQLPQGEAVWSSLAEQFELRIHLAVHTERGCGFHLSPKTMQLVAARHTEVFLDIYAYGSGDA